MSMLCVSMCALSTMCSMRVLVCDWIPAIPLFLFFSLCYNRSVRQFFFLFLFLKKTTLDFFIVRQTKLKRKRKKSINRGKWKPHTNVATSCIHGSTYKIIFLRLKSLNLTMSVQSSCTEVQERNMYTFGSHLQQRKAKKQNFLVRLMWAKGENKKKKKKNLYSSSRKRK